MKRAIVCQIARGKLARLREKLDGRLLMCGFAQGEGAVKQSSEGFEAA